MLQLVENLLISAKLETAYQPDFQEVNLAAMLDELISKQKQRHPNVKFNFAKEGQIPLAHMDENGTTLLFNNLVENAVKYSNGHPEIDISLSSRDQQIILQVADHGIGIPEEDKTRIFEKFYRIGNEETRKTKGTGLGLFIVNQIVRAHRGQIRVLDNKPKGTIFRIEIPLQV